MTISSCMTLFVVAIVAYTFVGLDAVGEESEMPSVAYQGREEQRWTAIAP